MQHIIGAIGSALSYIMRFCIELVGGYGLAVILFAVATKIILFPLSLWVQGNSIKLVKIKPELDTLKYRYTDDDKAFLREQKALYKREHYSPTAGIWPLLLQLPFIFGLLDIIYNPLKHLLRLPSNVIDAFTSTAQQILGTTDLGRSPQLRVIELLENSANIPAFQQLQSSLSGTDVAGVIERIRGIDMQFLGLNLSQIPSFTNPGWVLLVPIIAGLSALVMCAVQNKINVLQLEQTKLNKWVTTILMVGISTYFAFVVPAIVGVYWTAGNLLAIPVMMLVNVVMPPKKYIDYKLLEKTKQATAEKAELKKKYLVRSKADYKRFCAEKNQQDMRVMFYSKSSGYYKYFKAIIDSLLETTDYVIHYVTSDPNDKVLSAETDRFIPYYVDDDRLIPLMMKVESYVVVMTMPDLEKYHIKRSRVRKDVEYIYTEHACNSINLSYRTGAFDHFDTFFAVSDYQKRELRAIEKLRDTKEKTIVECGYALIDTMIAEYEAQEKHKNPKPVVMIAPSWQRDNILDSCLDELVGSLSGQGYKIIIRPHPQYIIRFPAGVQKLVEAYGSADPDDIVLELDFSSNSSVFNSDLVVTDWSSIGFEFSFTTKSPLCSSTPK